MTSTDWDKCGPFAHGCRLACGEGPTWLMQRPNVNTRVEESLPLIFLSICGLETFNKEEYDKQEFRINRVIMPALRWNRPAFHRLVLLE